MTDASHQLTNEFKKALCHTINHAHQNISLHAKNIFENGELETEATVMDSLTVQAALTGGRLA